jgi:hypothetical protein
MRKDERITQIQQESLLENAKNEATEIQVKVTEVQQAVKCIMYDIFERVIYKCSEEYAVS